MSSCALTHFRQSKPQEHPWKPSHLWSSRSRALQTWLITSSDTFLRLFSFIFPFYGSNYDVLHLPFSFTCTHFFLNPLFPMYLCKPGIYMLKGSPEDLRRVTWQPKFILHMSPHITPHFWTWQWIYGHVYAYYITLQWLGEPRDDSRRNACVNWYFVCVCVWKWCHGCCLCTLF